MDRNLDFFRSSLGRDSVIVHVFFLWYHLPFYQGISLATPGYSGNEWAKHRL
jgi:hypothetical protein